MSGHNCKDTDSVNWCQLILDLLLIHLLLQVAVDIDYARSMYELHKKVNANEMIVGWSVCFYYSFEVKTCESYLNSILCFILW